MCWSVPFNFRSSRGYIPDSSSQHHQIGSVNLCHCCHVVLWLYHYMLSVPYISREIRVSFLLFLCSPIMRANNRVYYGPMIVSVCIHITIPHFRLYENVSEGIEFLKCLLGTLCRGSAYLFCLMLIVKRCLLYLNVITNMEVWSICHCLGLDPETMVCIHVFCFLLHQRYSTVSCCINLCLTQCCTKINWRGATFSLCHNYWYHFNMKLHKFRVV